jgi:hypothetical protein
VRNAVRAGCVEAVWDWFPPACRDRKPHCQPRHRYERGGLGMVRGVVGGGAVVVVWDGEVVVGVVDGAVAGDESGAGDAMIGALVGDGVTCAVVGVVI